MYLGLGRAGDVAQGEGFRWEVERDRSAEVGWSSPGRAEDGEGQALSQAEVAWGGAGCVGLSGCRNL